MLGKIGITWSNDAESTTMSLTAKNIMQLMKKRASTKNRIPAKKFSCLETADLRCGISFTTEASLSSRLVNLRLLVVAHQACTFGVKVFERIFSGTTRKRATTPTQPKKSGHLSIWPNSIPPNEQPDDCTIVHD